MNTVNAALTWIVGLLLAPFASAPLVGLLVGSTIAGVAMTYVFGKTSNQKALRLATDRSRAQLLAIKLFKDDLNVSLLCQIDLLKATGLRLWHSLPPILVMGLPLVILLTQLAARYEYRPLRTGEQAVVELQLSPDSWTRYQNVKLQAPPGIVIETDSLRDPGNHQLTWRIRPETDQPATLRWKLGDETIEKRLAVSDGAQPLQIVACRRPGATLGDRLLHPAEPGFHAQSAVLGVTVGYAPRQTPIFGFDAPWWITYLVVSMLASWLVRGRLRVCF